MTGWITLAIVALVTIAAAIILVIVWLCDGKALSEKTFVCGECGKEFSPKWWKAGFSAHMGENTALTCPHCGKKSFCPPTCKEK